MSPPKILHMNPPTHPVDVTNFQPEDVRLFDIAHSLSHQGRFNGYLKEFYSVAQHLVLTQRLAAHFDEPIEIQRACLIHDAAETYLADLPTPVKVLVPDYLKLERAVEEVLWPTLGVPATDEVRERVKIYDTHALHLEANALLFYNSGWIRPDRELVIRFPIRPQDPKVVFHTFCNRLRDFGYNISKDPNQIWLPGYES